MQPKTKSQIRRTFRNITAHIINETGGHYLSHTKLKFVGGRYSYAMMDENVIYFSIPEYHYDFSLQSTIEYKKVLRRIKMPYYCCCNGYHRILTPEPDVYALLHEIAHIMTDRIHGNVPSHGEEFCDIYLRIIEMVEPKTTSPINDGLIGWD